MTTISTQTDQDYIDGTITAVEEKDIGNDYGWTITFVEEDGADYELGFYLSQPMDTSWRPEVGESIRAYGFNGIQPVRGVHIGGIEIFHYTQEEWDLIAKRDALERTIDRINQELQELSGGRSSN